MQKVFGISLVAVLAATPVVAGAAVTGNEAPESLNYSYLDNHFADQMLLGERADSKLIELREEATAQNNPKYNTKDISNADRTRTVTASYVKGAYNAAIKGINKLEDERAAISDSLNSYATKDGALATIKAASAVTSATASISSSNISSSELTNHNLTANADITVTMTPVNDWETEALTTSPVTVTMNYTGDVTNTTINVASATVTGSVSTTVDLAVNSDLEYTEPWHEIAPPRPRPSGS